ncbi:MAG: PDZ domain-containing protein [Rhodoluna sp.]
MSFFNSAGEVDNSATSSKPRRSFGFILLAIFAIGLLAIWVFPTPYVIEQPGPTFNVLGDDKDVPVITVEGAESYSTSGHLDLLTVQIVGNREKTPSWLDVFVAWSDPARSVLPLDEVFPANQTVEQSKAESSAMMEQSQQEAIAVALTKLGYEVPVNIYISEVQKDSASSGQLVAADFVRTVNGQKVTSIEGLRTLVNEFDGKTPLKVVVDRTGEEKTFELTPAKDETGAWRLGIIVGYKYEFPIKVNLQLADVGGPSGGMMFALGIYDRLTPGELTGGKYIAGTGTIAATGSVGPIGGIQQKMFGAAKAGAKYFLAPADNCNEVVGHVPDGLKVFRVSNFDQAILVTQKIGQGDNLSSLATCNAK